MAGRSDILLHPVRLRIVLAMSGDELTTAELARRLPDVAPATLYRQVATLSESGVLEVVRERQVRGGVERTYRLVTGAASVDADDAASMTKEEHHAAFVMFVGALVEAFGRYLDHPQSSPAEDGVGYRQVALWLSEEELETLAAEYGELVERFAHNAPTEERHRRTLTTILIPDVTADRPTAP